WSNKFQFSDLGLDQRRILHSKIVEKCSTASIFLLELEFLKILSSPNFKSNNDLCEWPPFSTIELRQTFTDEFSNDLNEVVDNHFNHFKQFWGWTNRIHDIAPVISNEYNALAVKHQPTIKCKTNNNGDADVSATKIAGKDDAGTKIVGEEGYDATKIFEEEDRVDATKFAGESGDASEDQKAVSIQTTFVNDLFIDYLNDPDYNSIEDRYAYRSYLGTELNYGHGAKLTHTT
uniref:Transposase n=1 Tax=Romanomermis culicivorax TaxID=13658 RepID=A0A915JW76_ROMCU